jgi:hypothetical protein
MKITSLIVFKEKILEIISLALNKRLIWKISKHYVISVLDFFIFEMTNEIFSNWDEIE